MRALRLQDGELELTEMPLPEPAQGEALVRVLSAGICNTDLELVRGYYPFDGVLGHEFVGEVEEGSPTLAGRRVVGEINVACGSCRSCADGRPRHCERRSVLGIAGRDGAFADYLVLPERNLHPVPEAVSDESATFVEPLAAALRIGGQVEIGAAERVLVVGAGKLGRLVARVLALTGCELTLLCRREETAEELRAEGHRCVLAQEAAERAFDVAVECTGQPEGFALARRALRPQGALVLKSTYAGRLTADMSRIVVDELRVIGSRCGPFQPALELLAEGRVEVGDLVEARYPLTRAREAFDHAGRPGALKILLEPAAG